MPGITVTHDSGSDSVNSVSSQDAIEIDGGSLAIASSSTIDNSLTIAGGNLTVNGALAVDGSFTLGYGVTLSGNGTVDALGSATLAGANRFFGTALNLAGATTWQIDAPDQFLSGGAQVNFLPTATVNIDGDGSYLANGDGSPVAINNQGTVTISCTGTDETEIDVPFNNSGSVNLVEGDVSLADHHTSPAPAQAAAHLPRPPERP